MPKKAAATPAAKPKPTRTMSIEHKAALAVGREEGRAVRRYLEAIEAHKPKRGRKRSPEIMARRLAAVEERLAITEPFTRLHLIQERMDLQRQLEAGGDEADVGPLEVELREWPPPTTSGRESGTTPGENSASNPAHFGPLGFAGASSAVITGREERAGRSHVAGWAIQSVSPFVNDTDGWVIGRRGAGSAGTGIPDRPRHASNTSLVGVPVERLDAARCLSVGTVLGVDLPDVLKLLHESDRRWRTLQAEGEEWRDEHRSLKAFYRRRPPGSISTRRGTPGPSEPDPLWQVWVRQPDQVRVEFGGGHAARISQISDGTRTWMRGPDGRSLMQEGQAPGWLELGPASVLVDTRAIPAEFDLEVTGATEVLGRACVDVRARPRVQASRPGSGGIHPLLHGADEVQLAVDRQRGVLLRLEAFLGGGAFYRVEMTEVGFDEELADDVFAIPREPDPRRVPGPQGPAGVAGPRRQRPLHGGPPDDVIGEPTGLHPVLVRTDSLVVAVDRVVAYPDGFELYVTVRTRDQQLSGTIEPMHPRSWGGAAAFPGESLRFGVVFSDGRRSFADNFQRGPVSELTLIPLSGSGTVGRFDQRFWVRPLPPPGPVGLIVEWERRELPETRADVPGEDILRAASRAIRIWDAETE